MIFLLVLGLLLLGSFVACYFSSKYWHWSHVLLTETVFLLSLAFLILAAEVFRIREVYGPVYNQNVKTIAALEPEVEALEFGTENPGIIASLEAEEVPVVMEPTDSEEDTPRMRSVRDLQHELGMVTRARGRMWRDVETQALDAGTLTVTLRIPAPKPHGIAQGAIIYAFEQGDPAAQGQRGPQYIGEFRVTNATEDSIQVQPSSQFDQRSIDRLKGTQPPWVLYENMPIDQYPNGVLQILAGATEEQLRQWLPADSVDDYLRHGTAAQPGDDDYHRRGFDADGQLLKPDAWDATTQFKFWRNLRDYNLIFQEMSKRYTQMEADHNALAEDNKQLDKALVSAKKVQAIRESEQADLKGDAAGTARDRQAIDAHRAQVETQLANARALLTDLLKQNSELALELGFETP
jgi:hypothetical protein